MMKDLLIGFHEESDTKKYGINEMKLVGEK
jgi:hypothetical protein